MGFTAKVGKNAVVYVGILQLNNLMKNTVEEIITPATEIEPAVTRNDRVRAIAVIQTLDELGGSSVGIPNKAIHFMVAKADVTDFDAVFAAAYPFFKGGYEIVEDNV